MASGVRYNLIHYTGAESGSVASITLQQGSDAILTRQTFALYDDVAHYIQLGVSTDSALSLKWAGGLNGNVWDRTTSNWTNVNPHDQTFYDLDMITFDDTGTNSPDITITTKVQPGSLTFNHTTAIVGGYKFTGTGYISGSTGLTINNSGAVILANTGINDFTGPIQISSSLQIGNGGANGSIGGGNITNNGALIFNKSNNYTVANVISGSGTLEQKGSNVLYLSGTNNYSGLTIITAGTLMIGKTSALGSTAAGTTIYTGATLDVNGYNLGAEQISVRGAGVGGNGAITNSGSGQNYALRFVTLTNNATFGGSGRWDIRTDNPTSTPASLTGNGYTLTKVGDNSIYLVNLGNTGLGNINVIAGTLGIQGTTTMGDSSKTVTVASGARLCMWALPGTNILLKNMILEGGTLQTTSGAGTNNTFGGNVTLVPDASGNGGILDAYSSTAMTISGNISGTGNLIKTGAGKTVLAGNVLLDGSTYINGGTLQINSLSASIYDILGLGSLTVGNGTTATYLDVTSVVVSHLSIAAGSRLTVSGGLGSPLSDSMTPVPEPSSIVLLFFTGLTSFVIWCKKII